MIIRRRVFRPALFVVAVTSVFFISRQQVTTSKGPFRNFGKRTVAHPLQDKGNSANYGFRTFSELKCQQ